MIATWGGKVFRVSGRTLQVFEVMTRSASLTTEKQDQDKAKPSTYIKGPALESIKLEVPVSRYIGQSPDTEIESWMKLLRATAPYQFVYGGRALGVNKWLLVSVSAEMLEVDSAGNTIAAKISLTFDEWVREGQKTAESSAAKTPAGIGIAAVNPYKVGQPTAAEKAELLAQENKGRWS